MSWIAEIINQQQSSFWIYNMSGYDQDGVFVQSGGVIMVKSHHGRLRERIDGCRYFDLNFFAQEQLAFAWENKVMSLYLLVNLIFTRVDHATVLREWYLVFSSAAIGWRLLDDGYCGRSRASCVFPQSRL